MHHHVRMAPDRRGEVAVRRAREPRMAEVAGVVAGLAERPQHHAGERDPAAARRVHVSGHRLADPAGEPGRLGRGEHLRTGRGGHRQGLEPVGEGEQRVRLGGRMHPERRRHARAGQLGGDGLVGREHQLLDQRVGGPGAAAVALDDRPRLDPERPLGCVERDTAAGEASGGPVAGEAVQAAQRRHEHGRALSGLKHRLRLVVAEAMVAAHDAANRAERPVAADLHRHRPAVAARGEAAEVCREPFGQHRVHAARQVHRGRPAGGLTVDRAALGHERGHIGDVHEHAVAVDRQGIVVVAGVGRVDREREHAPQVGAIPSARRLGRQTGHLGGDGIRPRSGRARLDRQAVQDGGHVCGPAQPLGDGAPAGTGDRDGHEITGGGVHRPHAAERERPAVIEERLTDHEPSPQRHLTDDRRRRRRSRQRLRSAIRAARMTRSVGPARASMRTSGSMPRPSTTRPPGSVNLATVSLSAPPAASGSIACTVPLP